MAVWIHAPARIPTTLVHAKGGISHTSAAFHPPKKPPRKAHSQAGRVKGARDKQVSVVIPHLVDGNKLLVLVHRIHKPIPAVYAA